MSTEATNRCTYELSRQIAQFTCALCYETVANNTAALIGHIIDHHLPFNGYSCDCCVSASQNCSNNTHQTREDDNTPKFPLSDINNNTHTSAEKAILAGRRYRRYAHLVAHVARDHVLHSPDLDMTPGSKYSPAAVKSLRLAAESLPRRVIAVAQAGFGPKAQTAVAQAMGGGDKGGGKKSNARGVSTLNPTAATGSPYIRCDVCWRARAATAVGNGDWNPATHGPDDVSRCFVSLTSRSIWGHVQQHQASAMVDVTPPGPIGTDVSAYMPECVYCAKRDFGGPRSIMGPLSRRKALPRSVLGLARHIRAVHPGSPLVALRDQDFGCELEIPAGAGAMIQPSTDRVVVLGSIAASPLDRLAVLNECFPQLATSALEDFVTGTVRTSAAVNEATKRQMIEQSVGNVSHANTASHVSATQDEPAVGPVRIRMCRMCSTRIPVRRPACLLEHAKGHVNLKCFQCDTCGAPNATTGRGGSRRPFFHFSPAKMTAHHAAAHPGVTDLSFSKVGPHMFGAEKVGNGASQPPSGQSPAAVVDSLRQTVAHCFGITLTTDIVSQDLAKQEAELAKLMITSGTTADKSAILEDHSRLAMDSKAMNDGDGKKTKDFGKNTGSGPAPMSSMINSSVSLESLKHEHEAALASSALSMASLPSLVVAMNTMNNNNNNNNSNNDATTEDDNSQQSSSFLAMSVGKRACALCSTYIAANQASFENHACKHMDYKPYHCYFCPYESYIRGKVSRHVQQVHHGVPVKIIHEPISGIREQIIAFKHACFPASAQKSAEALTSDDLPSKGGEIVCRICSDSSESPPVKVSADQASIDTHLTSHIPPEEREYACPVCDVTAGSAARTKQHIAAAHGDLKITRILTCPSAASDAGDGVGGAAGLEALRLKALGPRPTAAEENAVKMKEVVPTTDDDSAKEKSDAAGDADASSDAAGNVTLTKLNTDEFPDEADDMECDGDATNVDGGNNAELVDDKDNSHADFDMKLLDDDDEDTMQTDDGTANCMICGSDVVITELAAHAKDHLGDDMKPYRCPHCADQHPTTTDTDDGGESSAAIFSASTEQEVNRHIESEHPGQTTNDVLHRPLDPDTIRVWESLCFPTVFSGEHGNDGAASHVVGGSKSTFRDKQHQDVISDVLNQSQSSLTSSPSASSMEQVRRHSGNLNRPGGSSPPMSSYAASLLRKLICHLCGQPVADNPKSVGIHVKNHLNYRPYRCPDCRYASCEQSKARRHIEHVHGRSGSDLIIDATSASAEMTIPPIAGRATTTSSSSSSSTHGIKESIASMKAACFPNLGHVALNEMYAAAAATVSLGPNGTTSASPSTGRHQEQSSPLPDCHTGELSDELQKGDGHCSLTTPPPPGRDGLDGAPSRDSGTGDSLWGNLTSGSSAGTKMGILDDGRTPPKDQTCALCKNTVPPESLDYHVRSHVGKPYKCSHCAGARFETYSAAEAHHKLVHQSSLPLKITFNQSIATAALGGGAAGVNSNASLKHLINMDPQAQFDVIKRRCFPNLERTPDSPDQHQQLLGMGTFGNKMTSDGQSALKSFYSTDDSGLFSNYTYTGQLDDSQRLLDDSSDSAGLFVSGADAFSSGDGDGHNYVLDDNNNEAFEKNPTWGGVDYNNAMVSPASSAASPASSSVATLSSTKLSTTPSPAAMRSLAGTAGLSEPAKVACALCGIPVAANSPSLEVHVKNHLGFKPVRCGYCDYRSCVPGKVKRHLDTVHKGLPTKSANLAPGAGSLPGVKSIFAQLKAICFPGGEAGTTGGEGSGMDDPMQAHPKFSTKAELVATVERLKQSLRDTLRLAGQQNHSQVFGSASVGRGRRVTNFNNRPGKHSSGGFPDGDTSATGDDEFTQLRRAGDNDMIGDVNDSQSPEPASSASLAAQLFGGKTDAELGQLLSGATDAQLAVLLPLLQQKQEQEQQQQHQQSTKPLLDKDQAISAEHLMGDMTNDDDASAVVGDAPPAEVGGKITCTQCGIAVADNPSSLSLHAKNHLGYKPYHCQLCDYRSPIQAKIKRHLANVHKFNINSPPGTTGEGNVPLGWTYLPQPEIRAVANQMKALCFPPTASSSSSSSTSNAIDSLLRNVDAMKQQNQQQQRPSPATSKSNAMTAVDQARASIDAAAQRAQNIMGDFSFLDAGSDTAHTSISNDASGGVSEAKSGNMGVGKRPFSFMGESGGVKTEPDSGGADPMSSSLSALGMGDSKELLRSACAICWSIVLPQGPMSPKERISIAVEHARSHLNRRHYRCGSCPLLAADPSYVKEHMRQEHPSLPSKVFTTGPDVNGSIKEWLRRCFPNFSESLNAVPLAQQPSSSRKASNNNMNNNNSNTQELNSTSDDLRYNDSMINSARFGHYRTPSQGHTAAQDQAKADEAATARIPQIITTTATATNGTGVTREVSRHICQLCNNPVSTYASSLYTHVKNHMNYKPYACTYCAYRSPVKAKVRRHCANSHRGQPLRVDYFPKAGVEREIADLKRKCFPEAILPTLASITQGSPSPTPTAPLPQYAKNLAQSLSPGPSPTNSQISGTGSLNPGCPDSPMSMNSMTFSTGGQSSSSDNLLGSLGGLQSLQSSNTEKYACKLCGMDVANTSLSRSVHAKNHLNSRPYHCAYCPYRSCLKGEARRHISRQHAAIHAATLAAKNEPETSNSGIVIAHAEMASQAQVDAMMGTCFPDAPALSPPSSLGTPNAGGFGTGSNSLVTTSSSGVTPATISQLLGSLAGMGGVNTGGSDAGSSSDAKNALANAMAALLGNQPNIQGTGCGKSEIDPSAGQNWLSMLSSAAGQAQGTGSTDGVSNSSTPNNGDNNSGMENMEDDNICVDDEEPPVGMNTGSQDILGLNAQQSATSTASASDDWSSRFLANLLAKKQSAAVQINVGQTHGDTTPPPPATTSGIKLASAHTFWYCVYCDEYRSPSKYAVKQHCITAHPGCVADAAKTPRAATTGGNSSATMGFGSNNAANNDEYNDNAVNNGQNFGDSDEEGDIDV